ncbi:hypothetical protein SUGI_0724580 [Cryptomeria japonica]|nr:hypothetical protein SUGI_0724580 [Cryptomeria japonica]
MGRLSIIKGRKITMIVKTWRRIHRWTKPMNGCCLGGTTKSWHSLNAYSNKDDWDDDKSSSNAVTPRGHVAVYVGEDRQRFVIKTEYINHPLFRELLEEAEKEYGYHNEGPLLLPCQVVLFHRILWTLRAVKCDSS